MDERQKALEEIRREGPRRFARWDASLFDAAAAGPAATLADALQGQPDAVATTAAYLRLAEQAVGTGVLRRVRAEGGGWTTFLERCLVELVPALLPGVKADRRLPLLVKVWNLGEGLLREPPWLDRYVTACAAAGLRNLADIEGFLVRTLEPVLAPAPPSAWRGPFAVTVLDLRPLHEDFLPGALALAGPTLLRVDDRRLPGIQAAVLLKGGGRSELLGLTSDLGDYPEQGDGPGVEFYDGRATVGGQVVEVPLLRDCHTHAVARAGFVAACAEDSQRLWIVESPLMVEQQADAELNALVAECWPRAQAHWSRFLLLQPPVDDASQPSVAHIDLGTRRVGLHYRMIRDKGLLDCVEAILAHEVGHHVRYPATLTVQARLRMLEKALLPLENYSLINLFTDLLINDTLRPALGEQLVRVYQAFASETDWQRDPAFLFYLAIYEERWQREPGSLMGPGHADFGWAYPQYRAEAQVLGQNLFHLGPNLYTQFLYFMSVVSRYVPLKDRQTPESIDPYACGCGEPSADDWAEALVPDAREREAIGRAEREGWLRKEVAERLSDPDSLERRIWNLPGQGGDDATRVPEVMAAYYRRQAERYLLKPPPQLIHGEATTPTTLEEWEPGDPLRDVDWLATLSQRGPLLGAAQPLRRQRVAEVEDWEVPLWQPRVEIYLDVSGSMPDPRRTRNAMTLAAQILVTGAIRAGGWARALLYSGATVPFWEWCRSETEMSRFLMHYIGGGTEFPFPLLRRSVAECRGAQPIRVIITDGDFHHNYAAAPDRAAILAEAGRASPHLILLLHVTGDQEGRYARAGARVITVKELEDYPTMAAALAAALFEGERRGTR